MRPLGLVDRGLRAMCSRCTHRLRHAAREIERSLLALANIEDTAARQGWHRTWWNARAQLIKAHARLVEKAGSPWHAV